MMHTSAATRSRRKRARPTNNNHHHHRHHITVPEATLMTSLLWLIAFTAAHPSTVKAFVLANDRPSSHRTPTTSARGDYSSLFASTLAEVDVGTGSRLDKLLGTGTEERPEDVLDLSNIPLLVLDEDQEHDAATITLPTDRINIPDEEEVLEWAERYTSVEALREHFGSNQNKLWGDLQASTARRLYKTLLPRALLELSKLGKLHPQDLAPLAYQARVAAKLYARERCTVPARIAATLFDGFRQWLKYGKFQAHGMTYDQLWEKYAEKILHETEAEHELNSPATVMPSEASSVLDHEDDEECDPFHSDCEDLSEQVCLRILERSCVSNEAVDSLALQGQDLADETELEPDQRYLLEQIRSQLEQDMYQLLLPPGVEPKTTTMPGLHSRTKSRNRLKEGKFRLVKTLAKQRRLWKLNKSKKRTKKDMSDHAAHDHHDTKPWRRSRHKPWLSRSRRHAEIDSDEETAAETDDEAEDEELRP